MIRGCLVCFLPRTVCLAFLNLLCDYDIIMIIIKHAIILSSLFFIA